MAVNMAADTMKLWATLSKTDPAYVKEITGKQYKGNSPSPHWVKMKLTEIFGPAGLGWGTKVLRQDFITSGSDVAHYLTLQLWYVLDGKRGEVEAIGGTVIAGIRSSGKSYIDEDGPKKSETDALVKAASAIGIAADIFLGRWDDSKYVEQRRQEEADAQQANAGQAKAKLISDTKEVCDKLATAETEADFLNARSDALTLRPKLLEAKMTSEEQALGAAVKAAAAHFAKQRAA